MIFGLKQNKYVIYIYLLYTTGLNSSGELSNPFKLLIKEALLVSTDKPLLNKQVKSIPPPTILIPIFDFYDSLDYF